MFWLRYFAIVAVTHRILHHTTPTLRWFAHFVAAVHRSFGCHLGLGPLRARLARTERARCSGFLRSARAGAFSPPVPLRSSTRVCVAFARLRSRLRFATAYAF